MERLYRGQNLIERLLSGAQKQLKSNMKTHTTAVFTARLLYCLDVPNRDECPDADFHSRPLCKFTLRPSRDDSCTLCRNSRLLIVDYLIPKVHPVFLFIVLGAFTALYNCTSSPAGLLNVAD